MTRVVLKGVHKLNPTKAVMKTYHSAFIKATTQDVPGFKPNKSASQAIKQFKGNKK